MINKKKWSYGNYTLILILLFILFSCNKGKISSIDNLKICYIGERDKSYPCVEFSISKISQDDIFTYNEVVNKSLMEKFNFLYSETKNNKNIIGGKYLEINISSNSKKECIKLNKNDSKVFLSKITLLIDRKKMSYFYLNSMNTILNKKK